MPALRDYEDKYPSIRFERRNGVLQMTLHQEGGEFLVTEPALRDLGRAFRDVGEDDQNKVVILTGTGERFATRFDYGSFVATMRPDIFDLPVSVVMLSMPTPTPITAVSSGIPAATRDPSVSTRR